jgi:Cof subfamily protein (haloacid dehalogenase superfamily)
MPCRITDLIYFESLKAMTSTPPFRLAVFDMDDTLLGPDRRISPENVDALQRLLAAGVEVVIASGRHHRNISEFEETLGFKGWVISAGGAVVRHAETQELLFEVTVPQDHGLELFRRGRERGISLIGYHRTGIFCDAPSEWVSLYTRRTHQVPVADIPALIDTGLQKLIWTISAERIAELTPLLQHEYQGRLYVVNTEHEMLEFLSPKANKALATQTLAARLGMDREEILAFGDGNNDAPLLEWAGMSVAMAHGRETAKRAAKKISPPGPPETAVARSLEALFG